MVVHCASGAGRTGVILAIDVGLQSLLNKEPVIDVLRIVSTLKQDRLVLIQTPQQHRFVNKVSIYRRILSFNLISDYTIFIGTCRYGTRPWTVAVRRV